jgi:Eukaryotic aspartyl protease
MSLVKYALALAMVSAGCGNNSGDTQTFMPTGYPLTSINSITYTTNITLGGSQKFDVVMDTGSTTLAIASASCSNCGVTPFYTPGASATDQHTTSSAEYGDQSMWQAENYSDTVAITGDQSLTMRFGAITSQTGFFHSQVPSQGILGFGGDGIASPGTDAYVEQRAKANVSENFAVQLCADDGTLWFGGADKTHEGSAEEYSPLVSITGSPSYYAVNIGDAGIGSASIGLSGDAVVDTGTSIMIMPSGEVSSLISAVSSSPNYSAVFGTQMLVDDEQNIDCLTSSMSPDQVDSMLPPFTLTLPDADSTTGGSFTLSLPATQSYLMVIDGGYCFGVASVDGLPTILGDAFLHGVISIFDVETSQMGFAPQMGCASASFVSSSASPPASAGGHVHEPWMIQGHQI